MTNSIQSNEQDELAQRIAQALQLEQVQYIKQQLHGPDAEFFLKRTVEQAYHLLDRICLKDIIRAEQIHTVVRRYAFELNLGPEILELIGVMAQKIHVYALKSNARLDELISDQQFDMWLMKILELEKPRSYLKQFILESEPIQQLCLQIATHMVESKTPWLDQLRHRAIQPKLRLAKQVLGFIQDQQQLIEDRLEHKLASLIQVQLGQLLMLPNDDLADIAYLIWHEIRQKTLYDCISNLSPIDIEEFFVLIYESWRELRNSEHMQQLILYAVTIFLDYFKDHSLQALLNAVGLELDDLIHDGLLFSPSSFKALDHAGILEPLISTLLKPFYQQRAIACIQAQLNSAPPTAP